MTPEELAKKIGTRSEFYMNPVAYLKGVLSTLYALGYPAPFVNEVAHEFQTRFSNVRYGYDGNFMKYCEDYFQRNVK